VEAEQQLLQMAEAEADLGEMELQVALEVQVAEELETFLLVLDQIKETHLWEELVMEALELEILDTQMAVVAAEQEAAEKQELTVMADLADLVDKIVLMEQIIFGQEAAAEKLGALGEAVMEEQAAVEQVGA
jgi:hypothetical protein